MTTKILTSLAERMKKEHGMEDTSEHVARGFTMELWNPIVACWFTKMGPYVCRAEKRFL